MPCWTLRRCGLLAGGVIRCAAVGVIECVRLPCSDTTSATTHGPGPLQARHRPRALQARVRALSLSAERRAPSAERRAPSAERRAPAIPASALRPHPDLPHASGRGDAVGRDRQGSRGACPELVEGPAPHRNRGHRPRSVAALARRAAGAFLLAAFALLASAPGAEANHNPDPPTNLQITGQTTTSIEYRYTRPSNNANVNYWRVDLKRTSDSNWGTPSYQQVGSGTNVSRSRFNLSPGTSYDFRVFSCFSEAADHCSSAVSVTGVTDASGPPSKPLNFTATRGTGDEYTLNWNPPSTFPDTVTGYQVRYRERGTGPWTAFNNLVTTVPPHPPRPRHSRARPGTSRWRRSTRGAPAPTPTPRSSPARRARRPICATTR